MKWILNHLKSLLAVLVFGVTFIVIGSVMLNSYNSYKEYERKYNENDLAIRSTNAASPKLAEMNDGYQSKYKNKFEADVDVLTYSSTLEDYAPESDYLPALEGSINLNLSLDAKSFVDIDFVINSDATDNVLADMNVKVNGSLIEEEVKIEKDGDEIEWHHLVMINFALPEGDLTIEITNAKGKKVPDLKNIIVYANANISLAEVE